MRLLTEAASIMASIAQTRREREERRLGGPTFFKPWRNYEFEVMKLSALCCLLWCLARLEGAKISPSVHAPDGVNSISLRSSGLLNQPVSAHVEVRKGGTVPFHQGLRCFAVSNRCSDSLPSWGTRDEEDDAEVSSRAFILTLRGGRSKSKRGGHARSESSSSE